MSWLFKVKEENYTAVLIGIRKIKLCLQVSSHQTQLKCCHRTNIVLRNMYQLNYEPNFTFTLATPLRHLCYLLLANKLAMLVYVSNKL